MPRFKEKEVENQIIKKYILDPKLSESLNSIRRIMEIIWANDKPTIVKDYTDHGIEHSERVAFFVGKLLQVNPNLEFSEHEIYLLLAGVYLHDIGMQCDIANNPKIKEKAENLGAKFKEAFTAKTTNSYSLDEQKEIRENHHYLSAAWIDYLHRGNDPILSPLIKSVPYYLANDLMDVCKFHSKLPINDCSNSFDGDPSSRKKMVASLLRFADELDINSKRVNIETAKIYSIDPENSAYWWLHNCKEVHIIDNKVILKVNLNPEDFKLYGSFVREEHITKFKDKNQPVLDVLVGYRIPITIDEGSNVVAHDRVEKFPPEITATFDKKIQEIIGNSHEKLDKCLTDNKSEAFQHLKGISTNASTVREDNLIDPTNISSCSGIAAAKNICMYNSGTSNTGCVSYPYNDPIDETIKQLLKFAKFCERKKEYDEALKYYEEILEKHPSEKLLVKTLVGEAVCYHKKGNVTRAKNLIKQAENIDPLHPVILADIASLLKSENPTEAENYAKKALEIDQNNVLAKCVLGLLECERGNIEKSLILLRQASTIEPKDSYPSYCMSYVYSREWDEENSIKYAKEAVKIDPNDAVYIRELGLLYLKFASPTQEANISSEYYEQINKDYIDESIECFNKVIKLNEAQGNKHLNCEIYSHLGRAYCAKNDIQNSLYYCNLALDSGLDDIELYRDLGQAHLHNGDYDKAIKYYEPLLKNESITGDTLFAIKANLATAYAFENKLDKAETFLEELIAEKPGNIHLYASLSSVLERKCDVKKALDTLYRINIFPQSNWEFDYLMGRLHHKNEDYEQAVIYLKKSIKNNERIAPRIYLVNLYIECGIYEYALEYAEEIAQINPSGINFYKLSLLFFELGDYKKSSLLSRRALDAGYHEIEAYMLLCKSLLSDNNVLRAKEEFENALRIYPEDIFLKINYAFVLSRLEEVEEAVDTLNRVIEFNPKCSSAYLVLANIYFREGFYDKAIENAKKSIHIDSQNEDAHYIIGNSLLRLGNVDESVEEIKKVTEINPRSKYARYIDVEEFYQDLDFRIALLQNVIEKYQEASITISKLGELIHKETNELLQYINNSKVYKSLGLSREESLKLDHPDSERKCVLVDETILSILAKVGSHDLLKVAFTHIYITKDFEDQIVNGLYLSDHPNKKIRKSLKVFKNGWIEGLIPNDVMIFAIEKIIPEDKFSKNDISFMSLALDNNCICLTEDLLLRTYLRRIGYLKQIKISTGGFVDFLKYMVDRNLINDKNAKKIIEDAKHVCAIDFDNS